MLRWIVYVQGDEKPVAYGYENTRWSCKVKAAEALSGMKELESNREVMLLCGNTGFDAFKGETSKDMSILYKGLADDFIDKYTGGGS